MSESPVDPDRPSRFGLLAGLTRPFVAFAQRSWAGGAVLMACAVVAMTAANSPWAQPWADIWQTKITVGAGSHAISHSLGHWINDGLMVLFFLLVGMEIKREMVSGELSNLRRALLPIGAAVGGMAGPALIYASFNAGGTGAHGWGIPTATDIAFALGVMRLVAGRIPAPLFVFLTALAIADDLGAVLVIALFYTASLNLTALGIAACMLLGLIGLNRLRVSTTLPYAVLGLGLWAATLASGVHATVAGVALAMTIPIRPHDEAESLLHTWEHALAPWSSYLILPLFALANAGVAMTGSLGFAAATRDPVFWGIVIGLAVGKPLGITLVSWLLVRLKLAVLPPGATWAQVAGVACLAGIGFTMSLFIATLAFANDPAHVDIAKLGIITGSLIATVVGAVVCAVVSPRTPPPADAGAR